jgi:hypothetical protein
MTSAAHFYAYEQEQLDWRMSDDLWGCLRPTSCDRQPRSNR